jgi:hypothetical protein
MDKTVAIGLGFCLDACLGAVLFLGFVSLDFEICLFPAGLVAVVV